MISAHAFMINWRTFKCERHNCKHLRHTYPYFENEEAEKNTINYLCKRRVVSNERGNRKKSDEMWYQHYDTCDCKLARSSRFILEFLIFIMRIPPNSKTETIFFSFSLSKENELFLAVHCSLYKLYRQCMHDYFG